jgi:hypothetical protein
MYSHDKVLFIHAGGSKTGSSAIQNFCEFNSNHLAALGYAYKNAVGLENEHDVNCGNGMLLYEALLNGINTELDEILNSYFGPINKAICSSEFFADLHDQGWQLLIQSASKLNIKIKTVFFVRSVIPFFLSNYDQSIKNHGEFRQLEEWSKDAAWQHGDFLRRLSEISDQIGLQVLSFDNVKTSLLHSFFEIIDCDVNSLSSLISQQGASINRSLTNNERDILKHVNRILGKSFTFEISKMLIQSNPEATSEHASYHSDWAEYMKARFNDDVTWVNERFGAGSRLVDVSPPSLPIKREKAVSSKVNTPTKYATAMNVLNWSLNQLDNAKILAGETIIQQLTSAKANRQYVANFSTLISPDLPVDFDPLAYLLKNDDVLLAAEDPIFHYLTWGRSEGRSYSLTDDSYHAHSQKIALGTNTPDNRKFYTKQIEELIARNIELVNAVTMWKQRTIDVYTSAAERERELYARLIQTTSKQTETIFTAENNEIKVAK